MKQTAIGKSLQVLATGLSVCTLLVHSGSTALADSSREFANTGVTETVDTLSQPPITAINTIRGQDFAFLEVEEQERLYMNPGSRIAHLNAMQNGLVVLKGGHVSHLNASDNVNIGMFDTANVSHLRLQDRAFLKIDSGTVSHLTVVGNSGAHISNASISHLNVGPDASVQITGSELHYSKGNLEGIWPNGQAFTMWVNVESDTQASTMPSELPSNVVLVDTKS